MARVGMAALALAGTAGVLAFAGCGGSATAADPSPPTPLTSSASTATSSASPSVDPSTDAAILAAVQAYAAAATQVAHTASTAGLSAVADTSCPCTQTLTYLASQLKTSGWHEDTTFTVPDAHLLRRNETNADVQGSLKNAPFQVLDAANKVVKTGAAASTQTVFSLRREGQGWIVFYVDSPH